MSKTRERRRTLWWSYGSWLQWLILIFLSWSENKGQKQPSARAQHALKQHGGTVVQLSEKPLDSGDAARRWSRVILEHIIGVY